MKNYVEHSAEGSHWTKQNHKYIRKEGNRYIYPEDLKPASSRHIMNNGGHRLSSTNRQTLSNPGSNANKRASAEARLDARQRYFDAKTAATRQNAIYNQGNNSDYRTRNEQYANRKAAISSQTSPDYRSISKQKAAMNKQASADYRTLSDQKANRAKAANGVSNDYRAMSEAHRQSMNRAKAANGVSNDYRAMSEAHRQSENRKNAVNSQGGTDRANRNMADIHAGLQKAVRNDNKRIRDEKQSNAINNQGQADYKQESYEHRQNDPSTHARASKHYKDKVARQNRQAEKRAEATNAGKTISDYKNISQQHRDNDPDLQRASKQHAQKEMYTSGKRKNAIRNQNSPDYMKKSELQRKGDAGAQERDRKKKEKANKKKYRKELGKDIVKSLLMKATNTPSPLLNRYKNKALNKRLS